MSGQNVHYIEKEKVDEFVKNHPLVLVHWYASVGVDFRIDTVVV